MKNNILIVAAHPDDEALGCAGTIAKHVKQGDEVHLIILADGESSRDTSSSTKDEKRINALENSCRILGIKNHQQLKFPDNKMDEVPLLEIIKSIERCTKHFEPTIVYTHSSKDLNIDHQITTKAVLTVFRPQPNCSVKAIYSFETLSASGWGEQVFTPNVYVNIDQTCWDKKIQALKAYQEEMRDFPHARSLETVNSLGNFRGATVGCQKAEAYELIRSIQ